MNLKFGKYSLTIGKADHAVASQLAASAGGLLPWPPGGGGTIYSPQRENTFEMMSLIRETVAICMHARSEAIGRGRFRAYVDQAYRLGHSRASLEACPTSRFELAADHPLQQLLANPNPVFDMSDLLELSSQWLDVTGNSIWLKVRDGNDTVRELWPATAMNFSIERGADGLPESYRFLPANVAIPARDVIHIRRPDIRANAFFGRGILPDIIATAKADAAVRLFQSRFFDNDACPRAIIRWPQGALMTQDEMDRLRNAWQAQYGSPNNAGKIGILPDGGEVQLLSNGKELDFEKSQTALRDAIRESFRVPRIVFGDTEDVNLSNAETSYTVFLRDVVDHALAKHAAAFTRALASEFDVGQAYRLAQNPAQTQDKPGGLSHIMIQHDSVVPENEAHLLARVAELKHAMTIDEQRAMIGLPPLANREGVVLANN